jgi:hypothetical protein
MRVVQTNFKACLPLLKASANLFAWNLDKYAMFHAKNGEVQDSENDFEIMGDTVIQI